MTGIKLAVMVVQAMAKDTAMMDMIINSPEVQGNHLMVVNFVVKIKPKRSAQDGASNAISVGKISFQE